MLFFKKTIPYTKNWKHTLVIGLVLGIFFSLLLILLKPFSESSENLPNPILKLWGYGLCFVLPILSIHLLENYNYYKRGKRWYIINEICYLFVSFVVISTLCYFYHWFFISPIKDPSFQDWVLFSKLFALPFLPLIIPLWAYLRFQFGIIEVPLSGETNKIRTQQITIEGENKTESLTLLESDFIYAQAQQNYVEIYISSEDGIKQRMIRSTLTNLMRQLPTAWQVHRSYLVNLDYFKSVEGNARKRFMTLSVAVEPIPISKKYYDALGERLSNSSQKLQ